MTPIEIRKIKDEINHLKEDAACARQELQYSGHKDQIRKYIKEKETKIKELEQDLILSKCCCRS